MASLNKMCGIISAVSVTPALALSAEHPMVSILRMGQESNSSVVTDALVVEQLKVWYSGTDIKWGAKPSNRASGIEQLPSEEVEVDGGEDVAASTEGTDDDVASLKVSQLREVNVTVDLDSFDQYIAVPPKDGQKIVFNLSHQVPCSRNLLNDCHFFSIC